MSFAPDKGAWASTANWASSSNPHKRHDKNKCLRVCTSQPISSNMFSQDLHDASEQELNSTNLFAVTKDPAEAFSEACQHCVSNRYTCTRTIFASHEKFDDDENHAYHHSNIAGFGKRAPRPRGLLHHHLDDEDDGHVPYLYTSIRVSGSTWLVWHEHSLTQACTHAHRRARVCTWSCLQSRVCWRLFLPVECVLQVPRFQRPYGKSIDRTYDFEHIALQPKSAKG